MAVSERYMSTSGMGDSVSSVVLGMKKSQWLSVYIRLCSIILISELASAPVESSTLLNFCWRACLAALALVAELKKASLYLGSSRVATARDSVLSYGENLSSIARNSSHRSISSYRPSSLWPYGAAPTLLEWYLKHWHCWVVNFQSQTASATGRDSRPVTTAWRWALCSLGFSRRTALWLFAVLAVFPALGSCCASGSEHLEQDGEWEAANCVVFQLTFHWQTTNVSCDQRSTVKYGGSCQQLAASTVDHKLDGMSRTANAVDICIPRGFADVTSVVSENDVDLILQAPVLQYAKELCC